jgi:hypothetical protein
MRALTFVAVVCGVAALSGSALGAAERSHDRRPVLATPAPQVPGNPDPAVSSQPPASDLRVRNLRLDEPSVEVARPAVVLKFDLLNDSPGRVTDVLIEIAIVEKPSRDPGSRRLVAGPITMRGYATIEPGYTVEYKVLLRNLSSDCGCEPQVSVVSARPVQLP